MPVLMVSEKTSPHDGFSRNFVIRPSGWVMTTPYSSGFATRTRVSVTAALRSLWNATTAERSMSVSASPEITRNVSSSAEPICRTDPPVPSGVSSTPAMRTACRGARLGALGGLFRSDGEEGFEVVTRVHLERHVGVGAHDAGHLADPLRDDLGELVVLAGADHRDEVHRPGDR